MALDASNLINFWVDKYHLHSSSGVDHSVAGAPYVDPELSGKIFRMSNSGGYGDFLKLGVPSGGQDHWLHFSLYRYSSGSLTYQNPFVSFLDANNVVLAQVRNVTSTSYPSLHIGGSSVSTSSQDILFFEQLQKYDIHFETDGTNTTITLYVDGILSVTHTASAVTSSTDTVAFIKVGHPNYGKYAYSEIFLASIDTRGYAMQTLGSVANTAPFDFTGDYSDIDARINVDPSLSNISASNVGDKAYISVTNSYSNPTYTPELVATVTTGSNVGSPTIAGIKPTIRVNGTVTNGTNLSTPDGVEDTKISTYTSNPDTGLAWTKSAVDALEIGVEVI